MFEILFTPEAIRRLRKMRRFHAAAILDAIEKHLRDEPEKIAGSSVKRLRGHQEATYRLRAGDYRVFYDVLEDRVRIVQILHKLDTPQFYRRER